VSTEGIGNFLFSFSSKVSGRLLVVVTEHFHFVLGKKGRLKANDG